jgi:hypothetical protein
VGDRLELEYLPVNIVKYEPAQRSY